MRKLKLEVQLSIDGYIADVDGKTDWMNWNWGPDWKWDVDLQKYHTELTKSVDCILLSRQMAEEGFIAHWKQVTSNSENPQFEFAKHITVTSKVVFTKTLNKSVSIPGGWNNTSIANGDLVDEVNKIKNQNSKKDIIVYGGAGFVSSLIKNNLIDEYHLFVNPTAIGKGLEIFKDVEKLSLKLADCNKFDCGIVVLNYVKKPD